MGPGGPTLRGFDAANLAKISADLRLLHRLFEARAQAAQRGP